MARQDAVLPAWGQAVSATLKPTGGAACAAGEISAPSNAALAQTKLARAKLARARMARARMARARMARILPVLMPAGRTPRRPSGLAIALERNLIIHVAALATGAGHGRLALRARPR